MRVAIRTSVAALVITVTLAACGRHGMAPAPASTSTPPPPPVALSQSNLGFTVLAEVDNAQQAIELRDAIAADNDLGQALAFATEMIDHRRQSPAVLTSFAVRVRLMSAKALLTDGNLSGADAELNGVRDQVPRRLLPQDLPLLRAAASLVLARGAVITGGTPRLRTQLQCAQDALDAYDAAGHLEAARDLASTLHRALANPTVLRTLLPYQLSQWLGKVTVLAGTNRWQ
jgi:predicted small lipoprotein YifL